MRYLLLSMVIATQLGMQGALQDKIFRFAPLHTDLTVLTANGTRLCEAAFRRDSIAFTEDFQPAGRNEPRFQEGGIRIENGGRSNERGAWNFLIPGQPFFEQENALPGERGLTPDAVGFSGVQKMRPVPLRIDRQHVLSFYAKGNGTLSLAASLTLRSGKSEPLAEVAFPLTPEWQRFHYTFSSGDWKKDEDPSEFFTGVFQGDQVLLDAAMLEGPCVYFRPSTPTSYIPKGAFRLADNLKFPVLPPESGLEGAFALEFTPTALGAWQALLTVGGGWYPELDLSVHEYSAKNARFSLKFRGKSLLLPATLETGRTCHLLINYSTEEFSLWLDGEKKGSEKVQGVEFHERNVFLGSRDIEVSANGTFRNFAIFRKALSDAEIAEWYRNPDLSVILPEQAITMISPFTVFPVNAGVCSLRFKSRGKVTAAELRIAQYPTGEVDIRDDQLTARFDPAMLMPGKYDLELVCTLAGGGKAVFSNPVIIGKAMRPWENVQINAWNEYRPEFEQSGVTIAHSGLEAHRINALAEKQLYGNFNLNYFGLPRPGNPEDIAVDSDGRMTYPDIRSQYLQEDVRQYGRGLARQICDAPTFKAIVLNSEYHAGGAGNWANFSKQEVLRGKTFGLDLEKWRLAGKMANESFWKFMPMGYLGTRPAPELVPESRSIPPDNPLYAYFRERHSPDGGTEVVTNDLLAKAISGMRTDLFLMQDPVMRRPALRSYQSINVAQDWFYYTELSVMVNGVENLAAVRRGHEHMTTSAMPQFLFKEGMAAPFAGMPPRDMFREACWLVASRPMRVISFWNLGNALIKGDQMTSDEIINLLGDADAAKTIQAMEEKKVKPFCFDPRLKEEFCSLSESLWLPFGALLPKWRNAPRRLAVVNSFAAHLFGNVRWPNMGALGNAVAGTGIPFDILLDNDLENELAEYDVIVLPNGFALPEKGVRSLENFIRRGGMLIADENLQVRELLPLAVIIRTSDKKELDAFKQQEQDVLRQAGGRTDTPAYIEAMEELQRQAEQQNRLQGLDDLLQKHLKTSFATVSRNVFWNHLQAGGSQYLVAVNDLRIPGEMYGRFGKVREQGVPQNIRFQIRDGNLRHAYSLTAQKPLPLDGATLSLALPPGGGNIILFTRKPLGEFTLSAAKNMLPGKQMKVRLELARASGLVPVHLELYLPDGTRSSLSRWNVLQNGTLDWTFTVPLNAPAGEWRIHAREYARGQQQTAVFQVKR